MPGRAPCRETLEAIAGDVRTCGGTALVLQVEESNDGNFVALFDRSAEFSALTADIVKARAELSADTAQDILKLSRKLRKAFASLSAIDFFPGEAQRQTETALRELELSIVRTLSPDEPHSIGGKIPNLAILDYQGRTRATRSRPWVDRLASAWLIRRFIDPQAQLLWLASVNDCPDDALSFDFDGAAFSHVDARVTFEVLLACFDLEKPAPKRLGGLYIFWMLAACNRPKPLALKACWQDYVTPLTMTISY